MQGPARVLIVGREDGTDKEIAQALRANGFESSIGDISQSAIELSGQRRPDVVILNMQSAEALEKPQAFLALAKTLKSSMLSSHLRIMMAGATSDLKLDDIVCHIDDLLIGEINPEQLCHRLRSLVRLNTMHEELIRRQETSARYGQDAPPQITPPSEIANATVLVVGEAQDFGAIERALAKQATLVGALTTTTAHDYLGREAFDAVVITAGGDITLYLDFVREIRGNSRQYNLPVVLLADKDTLQENKDVYESGITDTIAKPYSLDELRIRIDTLVRESRFRDSLRHIYAQAKHFATSDALTGLYNRGFLLEHLSSVIDDSSRTSQSFSIAGLAIANMREINSMLGYAGGDRVIRQVGETIGLLIRGEDLAARYSGSKFAVLLPDTQAELAAHALLRINGVVGHTEFSVEGHHHPISVSLSTRIVGYEAGDTPDSLIERSWAAPLRIAA